MNTGKNYEQTITTMKTMQIHAKQPVDNNLTLAMGNTK